MDPVNSLLADRSRRLGGASLRRAVTLSAVLHVVLVVAFILVPGLLRSDPPRLEFVEVVAIPAADLQPGPTPRPETQAPRPEPEPEPPPPEPEPEPVEVPEDIPVLEPEEKEPEPEPERPEPPPPVERPAPEPDPEPADRARPTAEDPLPAASRGEVKDTTVAGFDDPDFKYDYYSSQLIQAIRRSWRRPRLERKMDLAIGFRIARNGTISDVRVVRTSGIPSYDEAGLRAVRGAAIPPLPVAYRRDSLGVTVLLP